MLHCAAVNKCLSTDKQVAILMFSKVKAIFIKFLFCCAPKNDQAEGLKEMTVGRQKWWVEKPNG